MKTLLALILLLSPACSAKPAVAEPAAKPAYQSEAPLPKGWPAPGPYDQVTEKSYPTYRTAITNGSGMFTFFTLFNHIKKKDIPMTAPVEMKMEEKNDKMEKVNMGFLYQNTEVGEIGADGKKIQVKDLKKAKALSYTWMGSDSKKQIATAKAALDAALKTKGTTATSFRMLGYNGPGTPRKKRTYELQAILPSE